MNNPAFEYLRQFKKVSEETEELVIKTLKKKFPNISMGELVDIFELGLTGEFGKVYSCDVETLVDWVKTFMRKKDNSSSYYEQGLIGTHLKVTDIGYPSGYEAWYKEVNKAYIKFLEGVTYNAFHPHIYDRLMVDGKIKPESYHKYLDSSVDEAKQRYISEYFRECKKQGYNQIYNVK